MSSVEDVFAALVAAQRRVDELKQALTEALRELGRPAKVTGATITYVAPRGRYDWESIAKMAEPSDEEIAKHSSVVVDWKALASGLDGVTDELKARFYTPGTGDGSIMIKWDK